MQVKRVAVSQKRQITIPIEFYNNVGIGSEVECFVQNNSIILKPVRENTGAFDEEILADLIAEGYTGGELLRQFKIARNEIRPAVKRLLEDADKAAQNPDNCYSYDDIFGAED
ncbi:MAG: AbrB/MazE/SpoVT family DNA-binding domain-containing protein [Firmicutes bacterium]|nr:AbrB/MazE/SpoVT family DNA-binding domain-containing protein [Bacillota bacterium]